MAATFKAMCLRVFSHLLKKSLMENFIFLCSGIAIRNGSQLSKLYWVVLGICTLSCVHLSYYDFLSFADLKQCAEWHDLLLADALTYGSQLRGWSNRSSQLARLAAHNSYFFRLATRMLATERLTACWLTDSCVWLTRNSQDSLQS